MDHELPGFAVPVHRSLTAPLLLAGVPRGFAILNGTVTAAVGLGLHVLWAIPGGVVVHLMGMLAAKYDAQYFDVLRRHVQHKPYYYA